MAWTGKVTGLKHGVSLGILMAAAAAPMPAMAQGAAETETIVVTAYRESLKAALDQKRGSATQVDAIIAEDIGKFPDQNLSESLQRIPGVVITREGGEGRQITVRGLGPTFTRIRLNGIEALATGGGTDATGGTNRGRSFDFNVFASDLFNQLRVNKTAAGETEEGSLGATVDLNTARPFDYDGFTMAINAQGGYNFLSEETRPRAAGLISSTFGKNNEFGALFSIAYTERALLDEGTSTVRWARGSAFAPGFQSAPAGLTLAQVNAAFHPRFPRYDAYTLDVKRLGGTASLQWKPLESTLFTFDALYARFRTGRSERFLEAPSFSTGGGAGIGDINVLAGVIVPEANGETTLISGTFDDVDLRVENRFDQLDTKYTQYTLNADHAFTDSFRIHALGGYARSNHENPIQTTVTWDQLNVDGFMYDYSQGRAPLLDFGTANLTNADTWTLTQIRLRPQTALNKVTTGQFDAGWDIVDALTLRGGVNYKKYSFESTELRRWNGVSTANQESVIPAALAAIPRSSYATMVDFPGKGLDLPAGSVTGWVVPDLEAARDILQFFNPGVFGGAFRLGKDPALGNNFTVDEDDLGGWAQGDFDFDVFGVPVRGNVGVRYVRTKQATTGFSFVGGSAKLITVERQYHDTLPAGNIVIEPFENLLVRFAGAKVMSRPDLGNLNPGSTVNVAGANRTVASGNPNLEPFRAKTYDVAVEWYFMPESLISLALFKKNISTFIQTVTFQSTFSGNSFGLPDSLVIDACSGLPPATCNPTTTIWTFTVPDNTPGGPLKGLEVGYQQPFTFLPGFFSHFGVQGNYTYLTSKIQYKLTNAPDSPTVIDELVNVSRHAYNATVYWENDVFSARVAMAFRDKYLTRVPAREGTDVEGTNSTFNLDFAAQYEIIEGLKVTVDGLNLTDEFDDQFVGSANRLSFYHHQGREVLFGFRYTH